MEKRVDLELRGRKPDEVVDLPLDDCQTTELAVDATAAEDANSDVSCRICHIDGDEEKTLECCLCRGSYHLHCLAMKRFPKGHWHCDACEVKRKAKDCGNIKYVLQIGSRLYELSACRSRPIVDLKPDFASRTMLAVESFDLLIGKSVVQPGDSAFSLQLLMDSVQICVVAKSPTKDASNEPVFLRQGPPNDDDPNEILFIVGTERRQMSACRNQPICDLKNRYASQTKLSVNAFDFVIADTLVQPGDTASSLNLNDMAQITVTMKATDDSSAASKSECESQALLVEQWKTNKAEIAAKWIKYCKKEGISLSEAFRGALLSLVVPRLLSSSKPYGHPRWQMWLKDLKVVPNVDAADFVEKEFNAHLESKALELCQGVDILNLVGVYFSQKVLTKKDSGCKAVLESLIELYVVATEQHSAKDAQQCFVDGFYEKYGLSATQESIDPERFFENGIRTPLISALFMLCLSYTQMMIDVFGHSRCIINDIKEENVPTAEMAQNFDRFDRAYAMKEPGNEEFGELFLFFLRLSEQRPLNVRCLLMLCQSHAAKESNDYAGSVFVSRAYVSSLCEVGRSATERNADRCEAATFRILPCNRYSSSSSDAVRQAEMDFALSWLHSNRRLWSSGHQGMVCLLGQLQEKLIRIRCERQTNADNVSKQQFDEPKKDSAKAMADQSCKSTTTSGEKATAAKRAVCTENTNELRGGSAEDMPRSKKRTNNKPVKQVGQPAKASVTSEANEPSSPDPFFGSRQKDCKDKADDHKGDKKASNANSKAASDRAVAGGGDSSLSIDPGPRLCGSEAKLFAELQDGSAALLKADFEEAFRHYSAAFQLTQSEPSLATCEHEWYSLAVFAYAYAYAASNTVQLSQQTVKNVMAILEGVEQSVTRFPLVYYGKALINFKTNDFAKALSELENVATILDNKIPLRLYCWPATKTIIAESDPVVLEERSAALNKQCRNAPRPTAICHSGVTECVKCGYTRQTMYVSDVNFAGFVRITCQSKCKIEWHPNCFKAFMKNGGYSEPRDLEGSASCFTPDCGSELEVIEWFKADMIKNKTLKLTTGKKAAKQRQQPTGEAEARGRRPDKAANKEPVNALANRRRSVSMKKSFTSTDQHACGSENAVSTGSFDIEEDEEDSSGGLPPTSDLAEQLQSEHQRLLAEQELLEASIAEIEDSFAILTNERKGVEAELKRNEPDRKAAEESSKRISDLEQDVERWEHKATQVEMDLKKADQEREQLQRKVDELRVKKDQGRLDALAACLQEEVDRSIDNEARERSRAAAIEVEVLKQKREVEEYKLRLAIGRADQRIRFTRNRLDWYFENKFHKYEQPCRDHIAQWDAYKRKLEQLWTTFSAAIDTQINNIEHHGLPLSLLQPVEMGALPEGVDDLICPTPFTLTHEASMAAAAATEKGQMRNGPSFAPTSAPSPLFPPPPPVDFPVRPSSGPLFGPPASSFAHPVVSAITLPSTAMPSQRASPIPFFDDHQFYHGSHDKFSNPARAHQSASATISGAFFASLQPNTTSAGSHALPATAIPRPFQPDGFSMLPRARAHGSNSALQNENQPGSSVSSHATANRFAPNEDLPSTNAMHSNSLQPKTLQQAAASLHSHAKEFQPSGATGRMSGVVLSRAGDLPPPLFGTAAASRFASRAISPDNVSDDNKKHKREEILNRTIAKVQAEIGKRGIFYSDEEIKRELIALNKKEPVGKKANEIYTRLVAHLTQNAPGSGPNRGPSGGQAAASVFGAAAAAAPPSDSFDKDRCSICLEDLENGQPTTRNVCGHVHHTECLAEWQKTMQSCPKCRALALPEHDYPPLC